MLLILNVDVLITTEKLYRPSKAIGRGAVVKYKFTPAGVSDDEAWGRSSACCQRPSWVVGRNCAHLQYCNTYRIYHTSFSKVNHFIICALPPHYHQSSNGSWHSIHFFLPTTWACTFLLRNLPNQKQILFCWHPSHNATSWIGAKLLYFQIL